RRILRRRIRREGSQNRRETDLMMTLKLLKSPLGASAGGLALRMACLHPVHQGTNAAGRHFRRKNAGKPVILRRIPTDPNGSRRVHSLVFTSCGQGGINDDASRTKRGVYIHFTAI